MGYYSINGTNEKAIQNYADSVHKKDYFSYSRLEHTE